MSAHELQHVIDALGRTLLHFLWQGVVIALVLEAWLAATKQRPSGERYLARCAGLLLLCAAPAWTFALLWMRGPIGPDPILEAVASSAVAADLTRTAQELGTLPLLVSLWAVGVALFSLRLVGGCAELIRLRRRLVGAPLTPEWQERFDAAAHRLGTRAKALVVDSAVVAVPTVIGYVKPIVLLPARIFTGLTSDQLEALIAHELAHVARHDTLVNLAQSVVESLFFYHPAVWWISRGLRTEREFCCDDRAVVATQDGLSYARALAALEAWRGPQPQLGVSTLGGSLMQRIQRLVGEQPGRPSGASPRHAIATLAALSALGATAFGFASWTAPEAAQDCECNCHGETTKREPVRWRVITTDDAGGATVEDLILEGASGASSGGAVLLPGRYAVGVDREVVDFSKPQPSARTLGVDARAHSEHDLFTTETRSDLNASLELLGRQTFRLERSIDSGRNVDAELLNLAQLERQLAELKIELGDLAQQRAHLQHESTGSGEVRGVELREYLGSGTVRGLELHENHGDVHESHQDASGQQGPHDEGVWIDAIIETGDGQGPHVFRLNQDAGGREGFVIRGLLSVDGDGRQLGIAAKALRGADGEDRQSGIEVEARRDAKGDVHWRRTIPGTLHSYDSQSGGAGVHTLRGHLSTDGGGRVFTTVIDGDATIDVDIDVEELHEYFAAPHGHSGANSQHDGSTDVRVGKEIHVDVHPELDATRKHVNLKLESKGDDSLFSGSRGNVFFEGPDGLEAFEGTSSNLFFVDSDGDGIPDQRAGVSEPHGAHGASGGGGVGGQHATTRRYLRLRDLEGDNLVIEEVHGEVKKGEILFDDHGVRVRQLEGGVLSVETGTGGEEVYIELRTQFDSDTGVLEVEPVIERVKGKADVSTRKPEKVRLRRSERSPM